MSGKRKEFVQMVYLSFYHITVNCTSKILWITLVTTVEEQRHISNPKWFYV